VGPSDCETAALDMPVGLTLAQVEAVAQLRHDIPPARSTRSLEHTGYVRRSDRWLTLTECISANVELARD